MRVRTLILAFFLLVAAAPARGAEDSLRAASDSLFARADTSAVDSLRARPTDMAFAWKYWKEIDRAIALRPLDGPDDILEKAEIIADRIDALSGEQGALDKGLQEWEERHEVLETQIEVLDDLARVQRGGDLQLQQRLHNMREGRRAAWQRVRAFRRSLDELRAESKRLSELADLYQQKAADLRQREEGNR